MYRSFGNLLLVLSLLLWFIPATLMAEKKTSSSELELEGDLLFQKNCSVCHGSTGSGGVGIPLNLNDFLSTASDQYLYQTIRLGRPGRVMPAFQQLSDDQVYAIIRFIRSWNPDIKAAEYSPDLIKADSKKGQEIFDSICSECHGTKGAGGKGTGVTFSRPRDAEIIAPAIGNPAFLAAASDQMLKRIIMTGRRNTPMLPAESWGIKEDDVEHVVSYLRSLAPKKDRKHLQNNSNSANSAVLAYKSSYSLSETIKNIKGAAVGYNFRYIREQALDQGFVEKGKENNQQYLIYFCNFSYLNQVLLIDPRVGMFLPFRTTILKKEETVWVMAVNPSYLCALFNNDELKQGCELMSENYIAILEESTF